jgi:hypothetical protein
VKAVKAVLRAIMTIMLIWSVPLIFLLVFGPSPDNNITCKKQEHGKYELCVQGVTNPVIVPHETWRRARVGGFYDTGTEKVYGNMNEDPQVHPPAEHPPGPVEEGG